jgi:diguanylate cyclase
MRAESPGRGQAVLGRREVPAGLRRVHRRESWWAAVALLAIALLLCLVGAFEPLENRLSEARARLLDRPPSGQIAIVEIDAKSLAELNNWPWSRRYHAELIKRLATAGVSMTAFDVDFSARSDTSDDEALAEALRKVQPVILPIFQQRVSDDPGERSMIRSRPAELFRAAWVGGVNILPGRDGVVRDFPAATMINGRIQPSMAVLLSDNSALGDRTFVPDWSIDVHRIPRFSFTDVLHGRIPAKALAGKRVIVGATAIELGDRYAIPRFSTVPGVVIQALAAESLLQHRALKRSGLAVTLAGLLLVVTLLIGRFGRFGWSFVPAAAGSLAILLALPVAVQWRWPLSIDTAPLLVTAVAAIVVRAIVEARHGLRIAALRDPETTLGNDRALCASLDEQGESKRHLVAAVIDRFEAIRSALPSTDLANVVAEAATRIERVVDSPVYRIAPDTLAWIAAGDPDEDCGAVADSFAQPIGTRAGAVDVSCRFGIAARGSDASSGELVEQVLAAIADARARGRTRQWFQGVGADAIRDLSIMGELRRGMSEHHLFVLYQPKLHLKSGKVMHAEALVRWRHPTEGLIPPDRFMPLAEQTGLVHEITRFVLTRSLADCRRTHPATRAQAAINVAVNVSAADISRPEFADDVIAQLVESQTDPSRLTLEITESAIISSKETALQVLERLRGHGVRLSMDDYGTGQSTLGYLKTLPVDELKIDKMFVTGLCSNESDRIMVRSTIDLAHQLGLTVVAEGVEDFETLALLRDMGCDYAQGFVVGHAMPFSELHFLAETGFKRAA